MSTSVPEMSVATPRETDDRKVPLFFLWFLISPSESVRVRAAGSRLPGGGDGVRRICGSETSGMD